MQRKRNTFARGSFWRVLLGRVAATPSASSSGRVRRLLGTVHALILFAVGHSCKKAKEIVKKCEYINKDRVKEERSRSMHEKEL